MSDIRKIIHIDMDCFYAAVEIKDDPSLAGKPLAVGGPPNSRSVLTTASYEARKFGVRSAMPSSQAVRLCPNLVIVPPRFKRYREESHAVRQIFRRFTSLIQPLSLDEAYLDVTDSEHCSGSATLIAKEIRSLIKKETGLTASAGVAPNKFLAKIASDWKKPDGLFVIKPEDVKNFVLSLKVEKIFGVGKVTRERMHEVGLFTCADIQKQSQSQMAVWFGTRGVDFWHLSFGIDPRRVNPNQERKSLTVEDTFRTDMEKIEDCFEHVAALFTTWEKHMIEAGERDRLRGLVVKIKFHDFKTSTHEMATREWPTVQDFEKLLTTVWDRHQKPFRLVGIGARLSNSKTREPTDQFELNLPNSLEKEC